MDQNERKHHTTEPTYQEEIVDALGLPADQITFINFESFKQGKDRFLMGFTTPTPDRPAGGFLKLSKDVANNDQLKREVSATALAHDLGMTTVAIYSGYLETKAGHGIIHVERLSSHNGVLFEGKAMLAGADTGKKLGARAAHAISQTFEKPIPKDLDTAFLKRNDRRNISVASFIELAQEKSDRLFHKIETMGYSEEQIQTLRQLINQVIDTAKVVLTDDLNHEEEYFVHNDHAPTNMFFINDFASLETGALILDFENAGAIKNAKLGQITELADFYRSCGINEEIQIEFVKTLIDSAPESKKADMVLIVKIAMVFGTILHVGTEANDRLSPDHPQHYEVEFLLENLQKNFQLIEQ